MPLATLAQLKAYLNITGTTADAELQSVLAAADAMVAGQLARNITPGARTERRHGNGKDMMLLRDAPIISIDTLTIDGQAIPNADSNNGVGYVAQDFQLFLLGGHRFNCGRLNVVITYSAGFNTVPADLSHAVVETAAQAYKERDWIGFQSKSLGGETVAFLRAAMPDSARQAVAQYARSYPVD